MSDTDERRRERRDRWLDEQPAVAAVLQARGFGERAEALESCRERLVLIDTTNPARARFTTSSCNDRACRFCWERRLFQRLLAAEDGISQLIAEGAACSFVTPTVRRSSGTPPVRARARVSKALARLRRSVAFTSAARGVITKFEGHGDELGGPHEHVHLLILGAEVDAVAITRAWSRAAREPNAIVDVRTVPPAEIRFVLAYLSKPFDGDPDEIVDRSLAFRGKHDVVITGELKPPLLVEPPSDLGTKQGPAKKCSRHRRFIVVPFHELQALAAAGVASARVALDALPRNAIP